MESLKKYFQLIRTARHYLAYQLFIYFGLAFALMLIFVLSLPKLDTRTFSPLDKESKALLSSESKHTEHLFNLDEVFERNLHVNTPSGFDVILVDRKTEKTSGVDERNVKALQIFIYQALDPENPITRRFKSIEISGPFLVHSTKRDYYQYFIQSVNPQDEWLNTILDSPWLLIAIAILVGIPILSFLSWRLTKPVRELSRTANAVATGNLATNPKLETQGINELREVGKSFNQMITSLQELNNYQQRLLSDISHELKTPLARLQLATAIIRRRSGESNELTRIENEIGKLDKMVHDLLALSRQQVNQHLNRAVFEINHIWEEILEDAKFETEQNGIDLRITQRIIYPERYFINGNPVLLASAMENVIRNAQKYANGIIKVTTYIDKNTLIITVDDNGYGVPDTEYEQIFRPFYRVDEARDRQTGGTGLGLAIVANAVRQHKGSVKAMKSELGGLRIEIKLPLWVE